MGQVFPCKASEARRRGGYEAMRRGGDRMAGRDGVSRIPLDDLDGRFIMIRRGVNGGKLRVVVNWTEELKQILASVECVEIHPAAAPSPASRPVAQAQAKLCPPIGPNASSISPQRNSPRWRRLSSVLGSTSSKATPPPVTSAFL